MSEIHEHFMALALEQARAEARRGGRPVCALIVSNGKIVGQGLNTVIADNNPNAMPRSMRFATHVPSSTSRNSMR